MHYVPLRVASGRFGGYRVFPSCGGVVVVEFAPEILRRYGVNAPRYTSYPTAMQFHGRISADDYRREAAGASGYAAAEQPLSLYVHIPFCADPCFYCACNRVITRRADIAVSYVSRLTAEIEERSRYFDRSRPVHQLHFGGGTPTYLSTATLAELMQTIGRHFQLTESATRDYAIEIDPRTVGHDTLSDLKAMGFNRLSLGVQDFDPAVQRTINRIQPESSVRRVLDEARALAFPSVNFDLIYGLPRQTLASFADSLAQVTDMRPDRIALYGYAHMPTAFKAQRRFSADILPDSGLRLSLLSLALESLTAAGYVHIGMDHFALPADGLVTARDDGTLYRNFQGYTTHAHSDLVSVGASAIGRIGRLYVQNAKGLGEYQSAIDSGQMPLSRGLMMTRDDEIRADVIQHIMCRRRICGEDIESRWQIDFARYFSQELQVLATLEADGLLALSGHAVTLTARGDFMMRNIAMVFDAYVNGTGGTPRYASRAI